MEMETEISAEVKQPMPLVPQPVARAPRRGVDEVLIVQPQRRAARVLATIGDAALQLVERGVVQQLAAGLIMGLERRRTRTPTPGAANGKECAHRHRRRHGDVPGKTV